MRRVCLSLRLGQWKLWWFEGQDSFNYGIMKVLKYNTYSIIIDLSSITCENVNCSALMAKTSRG